MKTLPHVLSYFCNRLSSGNTPVININFFKVYINFLVVYLCLRSSSKELLVSWPDFYVFTREVLPQVSTKPPDLFCLVRYCIKHCHCD